MGLTTTQDAMNALPLFAAAAARDKAIAQVLRNAGEDWQSDAIRIIRQQLAGQEVLAETFRATCEKAGVKPHHHNAWGGLTSALVRAGVIVDTGRVEKSRDPKSHARRQPVWRVM